MGRAYNAKILKRLLDNRPHATGAEVGVFEGDTSGRLLRWLPGIQQLICVDIWDFDPDFFKHMPHKRGRILSADWNNVWAVFKLQVLEPFAGRVWVIKDTSVQASKMVDNGTLDFVFIDGNHAYRWVKQDTYAWWPKIRVGGLLCGDDYREMPGYGVIRAVNEIFGARVRNRGRIWHVTKEKEAL